LTSPQSSGPADTRIAREGKSNPIGARLAHAGVWAYLLGVLIVLYLPLIPPIIESLQGSGGAHADWSWSAYSQIGAESVLRSSFATTILIAACVAGLATILGLLAAMAIREFNRPRLVLFLVLLPLFVPGVSLGFSEGMWFQAIGIPASFGAVVAVQTVWALPFSTLIILTVMSGFDPTLLDAAYVCGADRMRALWHVELPLIWPGLFGGGLFALILSVNETLRTSVVQGSLNTVATYIWSTYKSVGLNASIYALMSCIIVFTISMLLLVTVALAIVERRRASPVR